MNRKFHTHFEWFIILKVHVVSTNLDGRDLLPIKKKYIIIKKIIIIKIKKNYNNKNKKKLNQIGWGFGWDADD